MSAKRTPRSPPPRPRRRSRRLSGTILAADLIPPTSTTSPSHSSTTSSNSSSTTSSPTLLGRLVGLEEPQSAPAGSFASDGLSPSGGPLDMEHLAPTRRRVQSVQSRRAVPPHLSQLPSNMSGSAAAVTRGGSGSGKPSGRLQPVGSRWRRRTASLPDARPAIIEETTTGTGSALKSLAILRQLKTRAEESPDKSVSVSKAEVATLLALVEKAASVVADSRSVEMVMKYKFLTLPDVYDPDLQRYLLSSFTPRQASAGAGASPSPGAMSPPPPPPTAPSSSSSATAAAAGSAVTAASAGSSSTSASPSAVASSSTAASAGSGSGSGSGSGTGSSSATLVTPVRPLPPMTDAVTAALDGVGSWSFDVFALDEAAPGEALRLVGLRLARVCNFFSRFSIPEDVMSAYLGVIQAAYIAGNPYHNHMHGADIGSSMYHFIRDGGMSPWMSDQHVFASLLGALVHDVGHIAVNNAFLVATNHPLALTYNDNSPLENMHIARAFELSRTPGCNVFGGLESDDYKSIRKTMVELVLSTDNAMHFSLLGSLTQAMQVKAEDAPALTSTPKGQSLVLQIALHAADVSNPAKVWGYYLKWTSRLIDEFYSQGDQERDLGMPVTPMLDRTKPIPLPKFQAGFINAIVLPLYKELSRVDGLTIEPVVKQLEGNLEEWNRRIDIMNSASAPAPSPPTTNSAPATPHLKKSP